MLVHVNIHCRCDHNWRCSCKQRGGQHIISQPMRHFSNNIGRGRSNQNQISRTGKIYMRNRCRVALLEGITVHPLFGQRLKRQFGNKLLGRRRHNDMNLGSFLG